MKSKYLISAAAAVAALTGGVAIAQNAAAPDRNAPVTRAEAQTKASEMFDRMDANKDGKLDQADREARRTEMRAKAFAALDTDSNGSISKAEWDAKAGKRGERGDRGDRGAGMGRGDKDGHGKMGRRGHGGPDGKRGDFGGRGMMDANKDGSVTRDEMVAGALARFDAADADKNGTVTPEERAAAKSARRSEWKAKKDAAPAPAQ